MLVMIRSCPDLTADRLLFDVLWSAWIFGATRLEEHDLVRDFGNQYREYQARVPMLIPLQDPLRAGKGFIRLRNPGLPFSV
ncbi:MAG: hypothetical protein LLG43_05445 [Deltaproteobacteria bacterium]|nr:hypothetical protein [Deltaproteobacteria bacterium]